MLILEHSVITYTLEMCLQNIICGITCCVLARARSVGSESINTCAILGFGKMGRNNQTWNNIGKPTHGLIAYIKHSISVLEQQTYAFQNFKVMCV